MTLAQRATGDEKAANMFVTAVGNLSNSAGVAHAAS